VSSAPGRAVEAPLPGRRGALAAATAAGLAGLAPPLLLAPAPARAEQAWQVQLPRAWRTFSQTPAPPDGVKRPAALVVAGNAEKGGEMVVLRVPLDPNAKDPKTAQQAKDVIAYFAAGDKPTPVPMSKVVDAIVTSQKSQPGLTSFELVGTPTEQIKLGRRYVRFEFQDTICQGSITKASSGDKCFRPDGQGGDGDELPFLTTRHRITLTATNEGGETTFCWLIDVSGPPEGWKAMDDMITTVSDSFELGSEEQLEKDRTKEVTKEQLEALKQLDKAGIFKDA